MLASISKESINTLVAALKHEGLFVAPNIAKEHTRKWLKKRENLLRKTWVTPYEIAEYNLIQPPVTQKTIKNWCFNTSNPLLVEGTDWYRDEAGRIKILHETIKDYNEKSNT